jgi:ketosteroid isomerase-like protein
VIASFTVENSSTTFPPRRRPGWFCSSTIARAPTAPPAWFTPITGDGPAHPCLVNVFKEKAALAAADTAFADLSVSQGERTAFSTYVADDGVELAWDMAFGKEAVAAGHVDAPGSPGLDWQPTDAGVALTGELGYTIGVWTYDYTDENGAPQIDHGKYLTVWQKKDGVWRFVVDGGNGSPPPQPRQPTVDEIIARAPAIPGTRCQRASDALEPDKQPIAAVAATRAWHTCGAGPAVRSLRLVERRRRARA